MISQLTAGTRIREYTLLELLGKSAMGEVWLASDAQGQRVAVKTVAYAAPNYEVLKERFLREAANHQRLQHPAVVPIREFFEYENGLYLVMQYIPGGSLEDRLMKQDGTTIPISEAVSISEQILGALDYAHQQMVIHRDVKPSNILLWEDRAFLADFGISVPMGGKRLTKAQQIVGTRFYMSPEQILRPLSVTHLTDVFSFGCVLYEMLTGRQPFAGEGDTEDTSDYAVQTRQINSVAVPPRQLNPAIPERLEQVVLKALEKEAENRFPGCRAFAQAIHQAMREPELTQLERVAIRNYGSVAATETPRLPPPGPAVRPKPKSVSVFLSPALIVISGIVALVVAVLSQSEETGDVAGMLCGLFAHILLLRLTYKAWAAIQDGKARTTPGRAIGFMFIPVYGLVWCWTALMGLAKDYNSYVDRYRLPTKKRPVGFYGFLTVVQFDLPFALQLLFGPTALGVWFFLDMFLIAPLICNELARAINNLAQIQPEKAYAPASSVLGVE